jgi:hypothetical protein
LKGFAESCTKKRKIAEERPQNTIKLYLWSCASALFIDPGPPYIVMNFGMGHNFITGRREGTLHLKC